MKAKTTGLTTALLTSAALAAGSAYAQGVDKQVDTTREEVGNTLNLSGSTSARPMAREDIVNYSINFAANKDATFVLWTEEDFADTLSSMKKIKGVRIVKGNVEYTPSATLDSFKNSPSVYRSDIAKVFDGNSLLLSHFQFFLQSRLGATEVQYSGVADDTTARAVASVLKNENLASLFSSAIGSYGPAGLRLLQVGGKSTVINMNLQGSADPEAIAVLDVPFFNEEGKATLVNGGNTKITNVPFDYLANFTSIPGLNANAVRGVLSNFINDVQSVDFSKLSNEDVSSLEAKDSDEKKAESKKIEETKELAKKTAPTILAGNGRVMSGQFAENSALGTVLQPNKLGYTYQDDITPDKINVRADIGYIMEASNYGANSRVVAELTVLLEAARNSWDIYIEKGSQMEKFAIATTQKLENGDTLKWSYGTYQQYLKYTFPEINAERTLAAKQKGTSLSYTHYEYDKEAIVKEMTGTIRAFKLDSLDAGNLGTLSRTTGNIFELWAYQGGLQGGTRGEVEMNFAIDVMNMLGQSFSDTQVRLDIAPNVGVTSYENFLDNSGFRKTEAGLKTKLTILFAEDTLKATLFSDVRTGNIYTAGIELAKKFSFGEGALTAGIASYGNNVKPLETVGVRVTMNNPLGLQDATDVMVSSKYTPLFVDARTSKYLTWEQAKHDQTLTSGYRIKPIVVIKKDRLIEIDKTLLPSGATLLNDAGDIGITLSDAATGFTSITKNGSAISSSAFSVSGTAFVIKMLTLSEPAVGVVDTYVITTNSVPSNTVTLEVEHGSRKLKSLNITRGGDVAPVTSEVVTPSSFAASIVISSNKAGEIRYINQLASAGAPTLAAIKAGTAVSMVNGDNTINLTGLTDSTAYKFYYVTKNSSGVWQSAETVDSYSTSVDVIPPTGHNETVSTAYDTPILADVLANDADNSWTVLLGAISSPVGGTFVNQSGKILFTPTSGFVGQASCTYIVRDPRGNTTSAVLKVNVAAAVDAPSTVTAPTGTSSSSSVTETNTIADSDGVRNVNYYLYQADGTTLVAGPQASATFSGLTAGTTYKMKTTAETYSPTTSTWTLKTSPLGTITTSADVTAPTSLTFTSSLITFQGQTYTGLTAQANENLSATMVGQTGTTSKWWTYTITGISWSTITFTYISPTGLSGVPSARIDTITMNCIDVALNAANLSITTYPLDIPADTTAPATVSSETLTSTNASAAAGYTSVQTITVTAPTVTDPSGVYYLVTESSSLPAVGDAGWTSSALSSTPFTLSAGNGTKTVYVWTKDGAGNIQATPRTQTIKLDSSTVSMPSDTVVMTTAGSSGTFNLTFNTEIFQASDITSIAFVKDSDGSAAGGSVSVASISGKTVTFNYTAPNINGDVKVRVSGKNAYGTTFTNLNSSITTLSGAAVLPTAPTGVTLVNDTGTAADNITNDARVSWTAVSGATSYEVSLDGSNWTDIGNTTTYNFAGLALIQGGSNEAYVRAKNASGAGAPSAKTFLYDTIAPATVSSETLTSTNASAAAGYTSVQTITVTAPTVTDITGVFYLVTESSSLPAVGDAGWTSSALSSTPFTLSAGNGTKTVYVWTKDEAGNIQATPRTQTIKLDSTNPLISGDTATMTTAGASGTFNITFNTEIYQASDITSMKFVKDSDGTDAGGSVSVASISGNTVTFNFTAPNYNGDVKVRVSGKNAYGKTFSNLDSSITTLSGAANTAPTASDVTRDAAATATVTYDLAAVVSDAQQTASSLSIVVDSVPAHGTLSWTGTSFTYTATPWYSWNDSFTYHVTDSWMLSSATKTVTIVNAESL